MDNSTTKWILNFFPVMFIFCHHQYKEYSIDIVFNGHKNNNNLNNSMALLKYLYF